MQRLGIIAGGGGLPRKLILACQRDKRPFFVLAFQGQTDFALLQDVPHRWTKLGATTEAIQTLKSENVDTLVMAGSIRRPGLKDMKPDWRTIQVFARLGAAALGDDRLLKAVAEELEKEGFKIVGAHQIDPTLITPPGVLGRILPTDSQIKDIEHGIKIAKEIGLLDIGQAVVVQNGVVLGVEAVEGTDALLERCKKLHRRGQGGVLVKACKPQQDKRVDLPAVGMTTVTRAYNAGLSGIAVEAGASLLLDREEVIIAADKLGMFVTGFQP